LPQKAPLGLHADRLSEGNAEERHGFAGARRASGGSGAISGRPCKSVVGSTLTDITDVERREGMEAVIATGGKQYRVTPGQVISVEKLAGERGEPVAFTSVVLVTRDGEVISGAEQLRSA